MWGSGFVLPGPLRSQCNSGIIKQSEFHLNHSHSLFLPPRSAALRLLTVRRNHQRITASPLNKVVTSDNPPTQSSNPIRKTPNPLSIQTNSETERLEGAGVQLSGSDVLWALKNATVRKKQKHQIEKMKRTKTKTKVPSDKSTGNEKPPVDYSKVRPLYIKNDWGDRLNELEKRLKELPQTI